MLPKGALLVQALVGAFSCISICLAYVADLMPPQHRGASFGFILASFSFGVVIGPLTGALLLPLQAAWVAVSASALNLVYTALLLPESLSPAAKRLVRPASCLLAVSPLLSVFSPPIRVLSKLCQ